MTCGCSNRTLRSFDVLSWTSCVISSPYQGGATSSLRHPCQDGGGKHHRGIGNRATGGRPFLGRRLIFHTCILKHVRPFATRPRVTMLQVLSKMVGSEEFLGQIAFAEFVLVIEVLRAHVPFGWIRELFSTESADVSRVLRRRGVKRGLNARKCRARPRMFSEMQRVLVPLRLILVLETIGTILARILLF